MNENAKQTLCTALQPSANPPKLLGGLSLREQPLQEVFAFANLFTDTVALVGIDSFFRLTSGRLDGLDHAARFTHRNNRVVLAVNSRYRKGLQGLWLLDTPTTCDRNNGRKHFRMGSSSGSGPVAAHAVAHKTDASRIRSVPYRYVTNEVDYCLLLL